MRAFQGKSIFLPGRLVDKFLIGAILESQTALLPLFRAC